MFDKLKYNLAQSLFRSAFNRNTYTGVQNIRWEDTKPSWISLKTAKDFEEAARFNPVVKACINLLASSSANGRKYLEDIKTGEVIPWTSNRAGVQNANRLLNEFPNPMQSSEEFEQQRIFYKKTFGNAYVYLNAPLVKPDITNVATMVNLPSQFTEVRQTGKIYDQIDINGIVSEYAVTNTNPIRKFEPDEIMHFNEVNISSEMPSIMGISKMEVLRSPITNVQKAFEFMNTLITTRGMGGIISPNAKDVNGTVPLNPNEKKEMDDKFKETYGYLNGQNPFLISPVPLDYIKTVMSSKDMGIYEDFSNNSILISNEYGVPPELVKTYIQGATYENQSQSVKRLYQDTTIPMVEGDDKYWTYKLNCIKYGFRIKTNWDHIPALQENFKERAAATAMNGKTAIEAYKENAITWNQYLSFLNLPPVSDGDVYKFERDLGDKEPDSTSNTE